MGLNNLPGCDGIVVRDAPHYKGIPKKRVFYAFRAWEQVPEHVCKFRRKFRRKFLVFFYFLGVLCFFKNNAYLCSRIKQRKTL